MQQEGGRTRGSSDVEKVVSHRGWMNLVWDSLDLHHRGQKGCPQEAEPPRYGWQVGHGCVHDALLGQNIREIVPLEEENGMLWLV